MRSATALLLALATCALTACAHARIAPAPASLPADQREAAGRIAATLDAVVEGGGNRGRLAAAEARARAYGLDPKTEWIDWLSFQHNVVIELPGASPDLVYVVAHADKSDINPLVLPSVLLAGALDEAISWSFASEGALDNGTGVAVALELARWLKDASPRFTYRILLTGAEEVGLRGARAHAARLSDDEWARIVYVLNLDMLGASWSSNCAISGISHPVLLAEAQAAAEAVGAPLDTEPLPSLGSGDYEAFQRTGFGDDLGRGFLFNFTGGLLPQRSWFARPHSAPVLQLMVCSPLDWSDIVGSTVALPVGRIHGPRDNRGAVDATRLEEQYRIARELLRRLDGDPALRERLRAHRTVPVRERRRVALRVAMGGELAGRMGATASVHVVPALALDVGAGLGEAYGPHVGTGARWLLGDGSVSPALGARVAWERSGFAAGVVGGVDVISEQGFSLVVEGGWAWGARPGLILEMGMGIAF